MVSHGEAVRLEVIERLAKLANLAGRRVVRGEKLVLLSRQHRLRVSLGQERKGLGDHEFEREAQERIEQAGPRRGGVLLEAEHAGEARAARAANLQRLAAEYQPVGVKRRTDRTLHERHRKLLAGHDAVQELHRLGKDQAGSIIKAQASRPVTPQGRDDVARDVLELFHGLGIGFKTGARGTPEPGEERRCPLSRIAAGVPDKAQDQVVPEQVRLQQTLPVGAIEIARKCRPEASAGVARVPGPDHMRPQGQALVGDVAEGQVELGMQVIQVHGIGGFERHAFAPDAGDQSSIG